jgi:hypothetical protein
MDFTTALPIYTQWTACLLCVTRRWFGKLLVQCLCLALLRSQGEVVLVNVFSLFPRPNRSNPRCGFFVWDLPVYVNLICYQVASPASLWISDIIRSTFLTIRNMPQSKSNLHSNLPSVPWNANIVFIWILASCACLRQTTHALTKQLTGSLAPTMGTPCTSSSLMKHHSTPGSFLQNLKTLPLILYMLSCCCIATLMVGAFSRIKAVNWLLVLFFTTSSWRISGTL